MKCEDEARGRTVGWLLPLSCLAVLCLALCHPGAAGAESSSEDAAKEPLTVLSAASMTDVMPEVARRWEAKSGREVRFSFGSSSRLARQIEDGAGADVYVTAHLEWLEELEGAGRLADGSRRAFLSNRLAWVVPADVEGEPADNWREIRPEGVKHLVVAGAEVPAGRYARAALSNVGLAEALADRIVSAGDVRQALEWVALGEAEAGIVYRTDAVADERVRTAFLFSRDQHPPIRYGAAVVRDTDQPEAAADFLEFLSSRAAGAVFREAGFRTALPESNAGAERTGASSSRAVDPWDAVAHSVLVGLACVVLGFFPAVGFGWLLARRRFFGRSVLAAVLMAPLAMPPVVTGLLLLKIFGRRGLLGPYLEALGLQVPFSMLGAVLAAFVVSLPLYLIAARSAFEAVDADYEDVAATLGAGPRERFWRVTLPLALPGLAAGSLLTLARAMGEFGATIVLAGNIPGETQTIPLAIYTLLEGPGQNPAVWVLVGASLAVTAVGVFGYERLQEWQKRRLNG